MDLMTLVMAKALGRGGGSSITVEPLTVTQNGTQTAPSGKAYSPVTVNVPNSYANSDIGKVVNASKQLVPQSSLIVDANATYDTTYDNSVTVNVQPGIAYLNEGAHGGTATLANPFDGLDYGSLMDGLAPSTARWNAFISFQFQGMDVLYHPFAANDAIVTAVLPYWKGKVNDAETVIVGDLRLSQNASAFAFARTLPIDVSNQFDLAAGASPKKAQVTAAGQSYIANKATTSLTTSIKTAFTPAAIGDRPLYLCDTVKVVHPDLGLSSTAKVVETRYNVLADRYESVTIGGIRKNIVDTIADMIRKGG